MYWIVSAGFALVCAALSVVAFSLVRADRIARRSAPIADSDLFAYGAQAAAKKDTRRRNEESEPDKSDFLANSSLAKKLRSSGMDVSPLQWVLLVGAAFVSAVLVASRVGGHLAWGMLSGFAVLVGSNLILRRFSRKRKEIFDMQLAEALPRIVASVRGSLTLERALRASVTHMDDPLRSEFVRVLADSAYGMALHEALEDMARRTENEDVRTLAAATKLRQSKGGSMVSALSMISRRVNDRLRASRELRTEVASTRIAKWFVAAAMPAIFFLMYATNADFARFYSGEPLGWAVLGVAAFLEVVGLMLSHRVTSLD